MVEQFVKRARKRLRAVRAVAERAVPDVKDTVGGVGDAIAILTAVDEQVDVGIVDVKADMHPCVEVVGEVVVAREHVRRAPIKAQNELARVVEIEVERVAVAVCFDDRGAFTAGRQRIDAQPERKRGFVGTANRRQRDKRAGIFKLNGRLAVAIRCRPINAQRRAVDIWNTGRHSAVARVVDKLSDPLALFKVHYHQRRGDFGFDVAAFADEMTVGVIRSRRVGDACAVGEFLTGLHVEIVAVDAPVHDGGDFIGR